MLLHELHNNALARATWTRGCQSIASLTPERVTRTSWGANTFVECDSKLMPVKIGAVEDRAFLSVARDSAELLVPRASAAENACASEIIECRVQHNFVLLKSVSSRTRAVASPA